MSVTVQELRKKLGLSPHEFAIALGIKTSSLYNRLRCEIQWQLPELIKMCELMKANKVRDKLIVSCDGSQYEISIHKKIK